MLTVPSAYAVRHKCTVRTRGTFKCWRWYGYWPELLVLGTRFVLVHLHRTGGHAPACPPHWLVCIPPPTLTLSEQCSGSLWQKGAERDVVCSRAVTSVCNVVDREICEELQLVNRCDAGVWADGRMKLSFWTCRSKNSWVLYSYREVSETFHFSLQWSVSSEKLTYFVRLVAKFCFENSVILGYDPAFWGGYFMAYRRFVVSFPG